MDDVVRNAVQDLKECRKLAIANATKDGPLICIVNLAEMGDALLESRRPFPKAQGATCQSHEASDSSLQPPKDSDALTGSKRTHSDTASHQAAIPSTTPAKFISQLPKRARTSNSHVQATLDVVPQVQLAANASFYVDLIICNDTY